MTAQQMPPPIEPMRLSDVEEVMRIERAVFTTPWSPHAFRYDLSKDQHSHYFVLRGWAEEMPPLLGYAGFWLWGDEAHVGTIAAHPDWQRRGLGEWILLGVVQQAAALRAELVTLEVRISNTPAQTLYHKLGFRVVGRRRRYYSDTGEDGLIMTLEGMRTPIVRAMLQKRRVAARRRLQAQFALPPPQATRHTHQASRAAS
ncbi:MAG: ribosomal protein S18-alanine N-acetyltransferase [Chloroflexi bacterium]|nr:ribosomal protein S18-alanine N-acetyltransferase [Chloroflexota bacterium]